MTSFRTLALGGLALSLVGLAGGLTWAGLAFQSNGEQSGVGILFGLLLAAPSAVLALLCGFALAVHRANPGAAKATLTVAGTGVLVLGVSLLSLLAPAAR